jgi:hypothetical protein
VAVVASPATVALTYLVEDIDCGCGSAGYLDRALAS